MCDVIKGFFSEILDLKFFSGRIEAVRSSTTATATFTTTTTMVLWLTGCRKFGIRPHNNNNTNMITRNRCEYETEQMNNNIVVDGDVVPPTLLRPCDPSLNLS